MTICYLVILESIARGLKFQLTISGPELRISLATGYIAVKKCAEFNTSSQGYVNTPLMPIETSRRFDMICYDLAGPFLPKTARGHIYALIIVDHFTKWPEIVPLPDCNASTIAQAIFDNWVCRYGVMNRLHSDGAHNVDGEVMRQVSQLMGIRKSHSSRLHLQGDGLAEAIVKLLKSTIQEQVDQFGSNWDLYLQSAAFTICSSVNRSTGVTPAQLVIGESLKHPIHPCTDSQSTKLPFHKRQAHEFATNLRSRVQKSSDIVNETLTKTRERMKASYDCHATFHKFAIGEHAMLWDPPHQKGISHCFQPRWQGPWVITDIIGSMNCRIMDSKGNVKTDHFNQLKKVRIRYNGLGYYLDHLVSGGVMPESTKVDLDEIETDCVPATENDAQNVNDPIMDGPYLEINEANVLPGRTRSSLR